MYPQKRLQFTNTKLLNLKQLKDLLTEKYLLTSWSIYFGDYANKQIWPALKKKKDPIKQHKSLQKKQDIIRTHVDLTMNPTMLKFQNFTAQPFWASRLH